MDLRDARDRCYKSSGVLIGLALIAGGLGGLSLGAAGSAGADTGGTDCGPSVTLTPSPSGTVAAQVLTVPQYNGSDLTGVQLSLQITHTFGPAIFEGSGVVYSAAASGDNVLVEMTGPTLPPLGPYVNTAPTGNAGFTYSGGTFTAGDAAPALPTGLVAGSELRCHLGRDQLRSDRPQLEQPWIRPPADPGGSVAHRARRNRDGQ